MEAEIMRLDGLPHGAIREARGHGRRGMDVARMPAMRTWIGCLGLLLLGPVPAAGDGTPMSMSPEQVQEVILRVKPSAVLIEVTRRGEATVSCGQGSARTVPLPPRRTTGSGFVIHPDGYLATNAHVLGLSAEDDAGAEAGGLIREVVAKACADRLARLRPAEREAQIKTLAQRPENRRGIQVHPQVEVVFQDGRTLPAMVLAARPPALRRAPNGAPPALSSGDVAILKVDRRDLVAAPLGQMPVQIGDQVFVIGFPAVVLDHELLSPLSRQAPSVTLGRVSGFKLDLAEQEVIQTDAAVTWGNSGGPAFNARGEVIGVAAFISVGAGEGANVQGFNFLIPAERVTALAATLDLSPHAESLSGRRWQAAVRHFFAGQYDAAIVELEDILRDEPNAADARRLLVAARARPERGSSQWSHWMREIHGEGMAGRREKGAVQ